MTKHRERTKVKDVLLGIIKEYKLTNNDSYTKIGVTTSHIRDEARETSLGKFVGQYKWDKTKKEDDFSKKVSCCLRYMKDIHIKHCLDPETGDEIRGHWLLIGDSKYIPKICKALEHEYEIRCKDCKKYSYTTSKSRTCPECGSKKVFAMKFRQKCTVFNKYIASPWDQCSFIHGTDCTALEKTNTSMKSCYTNHKPNKEEKESLRELCKKECEIETQACKKARPGY